MRTMTTSTLARTVLAIGATIVLAACGAPDPSTDVLGEVHTDTASPDGTDTAASGSPQDTATSDRGPAVTSQTDDDTPWELLPDADRPGRDRSLVTDGCVTIDTMSPC